MFDRRNQHQHRGDKSCKAPHRHSSLLALHQSHADHTRQGNGRQNLGHRGHARTGNRGFHGQALQCFCQSLKPTNLHGLGLVKPYFSVGKCGLFNHIGQFIGGLLRVSGDLVQAFAQSFHQPRHRRKQQRHNQTQLPIQIQKVGHQGKQCQAVAYQAHE